MSNRDDQIYHFTESTPEERERYARMAEESTQARRRRGQMLPLFGALTSLLICLTIPLWYGAFSGHIQPIACLIFGVLISLFAIPCHLLGGSRDVIRSGSVKSVLYILGMLINTAGTSLCTVAYYLHAGKAPTSAEMTVCCGGILCLFAVLAVFMSIWPDRYGMITGITGLLTLGLTITSAVFWIRNTDKGLWSLAFFLLLTTGIAVICLCAACSDEESPLLRFASFASFGLLMIVAVVVLILLLCAGGGGDCDCDCGGGDCCDCGDCGGGTNGKSQRRKT
jgi:hypothetical protein